MQSKFNEIRWIDLHTISDARGMLTSVEGAQDIPFSIERIFYMHHVIADRGGHAHMDTDQVVVGVAGSLEVELSDGKQRQVYQLDNARRGLYVPRMLFVKLRDFSPGAVCLVLASTHYDMSRSIRSWEQYCAALGIGPNENQ